MSAGSDTPRCLWFTDDIIDGLRVILQRRGCKIQQGDILVVEQAIAALCKRAAPSERKECFEDRLARDAAEDSAALSAIEPIDDGLLYAISDEFHRMEVKGYNITERGDAAWRKLTTILQARKA
jgi:hypothetical protein